MKRLGMLAALFAGGVSQAAGVSVGGFVDAQWQWSKKGTGAASTGTNTFAIPDSALYFNSEMGGAQAMVDIPFYADMSGAGNAFTLGKTKAQAYVKYMHDGGFHWRLGQFDSIHGSEGKDTVDIPFAFHSMMTRQFMPWSQTGVMVGYQLADEWDLDVALSNPYGYSAMTQGNPTFGVRLKGSFKDMGVDEFTGSFSMGRNGADKHWLASGILGLHFGDIVLRGDGAAKNSGVKGAKTALGMGGYAQFAMGDMTDLGLRFGMASNQAASENSMEITVGPQFKWTKTFVSKVNYTFGKMSGTAGTKTHGVNVTGTYRF